MKKFIQIEDVNLQLFAEGGGSADGGAGAGASGSAGVTAAAAGQQESGVNTAAAGQEHSGVQTAAADAGAAAAAAGQQQQNTDPEAAFDALIKGEYKEQYNARVQEIVRNRTKSANDQLQKFESAMPIFDILAQRYGIDPTDYAALAEAAKADTSFFEKEAMERGVDVQELMRIRNVELDNASLRRQVETQRQQKEEQLLQQQVNEQVAKWNQQAQQAAQVYPGLKLEAEMKNPDFSRLLRSGVDVKTAYEVIHKDEVIQGAMHYAAQRAAKNVTDNVIAGAARPAENGTAAQGAVSAKVDPSKFTEAQMRDYRRRVANGERITF